MAYADHYPKIEVTWYPVRDDLGSHKDAEKVKEWHDWGDLATLTCERSMYSGLPIQMAWYMHQNRITVEYDLRAWTKEEIKLLAVEARRIFADFAKAQIDARGLSFCDLRERG